MRGSGSAYAALELEPGADRAAVEQAYRRLIKLHHPDRSGGDAIRAAEINRAYFELRRLPVPSEEPRRADRLARRKPGRRRRKRGGLWLMLAIGMGGLALLQQDWLSRQAPLLASRFGEIGVGVPAAAPRAGHARSDSFDAPLAERAVVAAVGHAVGLVREGDAAALAGFSRDCHRKLRSAPELAQLDRCAAFDSAVAALEDRDPDSDNGPFNASSVTARQMTAASLLTDDYLAIERRLNRIRGRVEMALTPPVPPPVVAPPAAETFAEVDP